LFSRQLKFSFGGKKHIVPLQQMKTEETHGHQILVVDDESSVSKAIKMLLEHDGHKVQTADSGEAALAVLEQAEFNLIITDYKMQGMNGDQLATLIKQRRPGQRIIMATAFADEFNIYGKPSGGVEFVLNKPFSLKELREAVALVLS
jgi:CheY-like chemotaxis protein